MTDDLTARLIASDIAVRRELARVRIDRDRLEAENARLKADMLIAAERVAICSFALTRVAERKDVCETKHWGCAVVKLCDEVDRVRDIAKKLMIALHGAGSKGGWTREEIHQLAKHYADKWPELRPGGEG